MRWYKHMTDAGDDPFIGSLIDEFGVAGYFYWFRLLEIICREWKEDRQEVQIPWLWLTHELRSKPKIIERLLKHSSNFMKTLWSLNGNVLTISVPNILKIRDNVSYRYKLGTKQNQARSSSSSSSSSLTPNSSIKKERIKNPSKRIRIHSFPEDLQPDDYCIQYGREKGLKNGNGMKLWTRMVDWHRKNGRGTDDLHASWRTFVDRGPQINPDLFTAPPPVPKIDPEKARQDRIAELQFQAIMKARK